MNLIKKITDSDFYNVDTVYMDKVTRYSARGVILGDKNEIILLYMSSKDSYKLPGGGIEKNETKEQAFIREVLEETGYKCQIIDYLGIIEEHKAENNFMQLSHCFTAKVISKHNTSLTKNEIDLGMQLTWIPINRALDIINESIEMCNEYSTKFMLLREKTILELVIDNKC